MTSRKNKVSFRVSINDDDFNQVVFLAGAYKTESVNNEIERNIIEGGYLTEANYPFKI